MHVDMISAVAHASARLILSETAETLIANWVMP